MKKANKIKEYFSKDSNLFILMAVLTLFPFYIGLIPFILMVIYFVWRQRKSLMNYFKSLSWPGIFVLYNVVNSALNQNWLGVGVALIMFLFLVYFNEYQAEIDSKTYLKILKVYSLGSIPIALLSLVKYLHYALSHGYGVFYVFKYSNIQIRAEGTFLNANYYGLYCIFSILISMYMLIKKKDPKNTAWYYLAIVMNLISIILTAARMLVPTVVIAIAFFLFFVDKRFFIAAVALGIGVVALLIYKPDLMPRFSKLGYAFADRFKIWGVGWNIFLLNPIFGRGDMAYKKDYFYFTQTPQIHAHQLGINCLANYGIVGCILLLIIIYKYIRKNWSFFKNKDYKLEKALIVGVWVTVIVHGIMDVAIVWLQTAAVFLGIILLPKKYQEDSKNN